MTSNRTITVILEYFPPRLGADRRIFEILRRLSKAYRITAIAIPPAYTLFLKRIDERTPSEIEVVCDNILGYRIGLPVWMVRMWSRGLLLPYVITMPYVFLRVLEKMIRSAPDVIIIKDTTPYAGLMGTLCARLLGRPSILDVDDLKSSYTAEIVRVRVGKPLLIVERVLSVIEDFILRRSQKVIALSGFLADHAARRGRRNDLILIPDGVDTSLFDPSRVDGTELRARLGIPESSVLAMYSGRIDYNMGGETLLETAALLNGRASEIRFLIMGEGDRSLMARLSKLSNVVLMGRIPIEEVPPFVSAADVVLVPYPNNPASHAASPLKLLEALAMEKRIIASAVSGIVEIVGPDENVSLLPARATPQEWASSILHFAKQRSGGKYYCKGSRELVRRKYEWNHLADEFGSVIESV